MSKQLFYVLCKCGHFLGGWYYDSKPMCKKCNNIIEIKNMPEHNLYIRYDFYRNQMDKERAKRNIKCILPNGTTLYSQNKLLLNAPEGKYKISLSSNKEYLEKIKKERELDSILNKLLTYEHGEIESIFDKIKDRLEKSKDE